MLVCVGWKKQTYLSWHRILEKPWGFQPRWEERTNIKTLLGPCQWVVWGRGSSVLPEESGNLKKKRLRIHGDSLMSCERFVRKLVLFAYCHLMTHWPSLLLFLLLLLLFSTRGIVHAVTWPCLWGFTRKIKIFVGSIVRISSNPRNSKIVNFKEAHDELFWSFLGFWFNQDLLHNVNRSNCNVMWAALDRWDSHDYMIGFANQGYSIDIHIYMNIDYMLKKCKLTIWYDEHREIHQYEPMDTLPGPKFLLMSHASRTGNKVPLRAPMVR